MIISVFDRVENNVGKGENAGNQHFLLYTQCFEKASFTDTSKGVIAWEWVNHKPVDELIVQTESDWKQQIKCTSNHSIDLWKVRKCREKSGICCSSPFSPFSTWFSNCFLRVLTHSHTMTPFDAPGIQVF